MPSLIAPGVIEWALLLEAYVTTLPGGASRRWSLNPESADALGIYWKRMPDVIQDRREFGESIRLEHLLEAIPKATVRISAFATDAYSGSRGYVEVTLDQGCLKPGRFIGEGCDHARSETSLRGDERKTGDAAAGDEAPPLEQRSPH